LCYAELATAYPRVGGDYVYLTEAYGRCVGFLFGWAQLAAILTGSIGAMAYVFADYAAEFWSVPAATAVWFAVAAVVGLSLINLFGIILGKATQNLLTVAKICGVATIFVVGLVSGGKSSLAVVRPMQGPGFGLALILVLYAYGGWNDAAFVAAEVRDPRRNIPRVLLLGTAVITAVYLSVNAAYLWALGFEGLRASATPASDVLNLRMGTGGSMIMSLLVQISALGAINGLIITGSRVYAGLGSEHPLFGLLARWNPRLGVPVWSILAQTVISLGFIVAVGTPTGRATLDATLSGVGLAPLPWQKYGGGFDMLVSGTAPVFWLFFLLTGVSLFVLRVRQANVERSFSVPWYPMLPMVFCGTCGFMLYASLQYARAFALLGGVPLLLGLPLYLVSRFLAARAVAVSSAVRAAP
jgi:basic amino acid/polyamine antiporter, APA family